MKLKAEIGGESHEVKIVRDGDRLSAVVDGRTYDLELGEPLPGVYLFKNEGKVTEASVIVSSKELKKVRIGSNEFEVMIVDPKQLRGSAHGGDSGEGSSQIKTAMPGKVVRILVAVGDMVSNGDGVIVVEAMKMQNELKAHRDGTIKEIRAAEGENVNAGDVLVVIE